MNFGNMTVYFSHPAGFVNKVVIIKFNFFPLPGGGGAWCAPHEKEKKMMQLRFDKRLQTYMISEKEHVSNFSFCKIRKMKRFIIFLLFKTEA